MLNEDGKEIKRKIVFVNEPLIYKDIVLYQTDWDIVGIKLKLENEQNFQIPLKRITKGGNRFWFGSLNFGSAQSTANTNLTVVINDLKGKIALYNSQGKFLQELQLGALKNANVSFCTRDHFGRPNKDESDYYIRFAYSGISQNDINEGMAKLKNYFES